MQKKQNNKNESIFDKRYDFDIQKLMDNSNSYKSLIYGIVTVIVLFIVVALGVHSLSQNKAQIDDEAAMTQKIQQQTEDSRYVVASGETLWSIAEKSYGDGFKWHEIAQANHISDPSALEKGTRLLIPKLADANNYPTPTLDAMPTQEFPTGLPQEKTNAMITSSAYVVVGGDCLWEIAVRAYGDGYRWVDIARANNLSDPDLIFSGNRLDLPRP